MSTLGDRVLDWMLRRLEQGAPVHSDLVLVHTDQALADVPPSISHAGKHWRIARVGGELSLRDVLSDATSLIAIVPSTFSPPPDIAGRAHLGRVLDIRPEDIVAALANRFCERIDDQELTTALRETLDLLRNATSQWTLGSVVTAREVRGVIVSAILKSEVRLDRESDRTILARWIIDAPPTFRAAGLLKQALVDAYGPSGAWLAWIATTGSLRPFLAAGALFGSKSGRALAPTIPGVTSPADEFRLRNLVEAAVREAHSTRGREGNASARVRAALTDAEQLAVRLDLDPADLARHPLLQHVLRRALTHYAECALRGEPADDSQIESLKANLYAEEATASIKLIRLVSRLARFIAQVSPIAADQPTESWFLLARSHTAWADLAIRQVRQLLGAVDPALAATATAVMTKSIAHRDQLNASFARALSRDWQAIAASKDLRKPLPIQNITRSLVRPLVDAGRRVFLVVLDGCDLSTFIELIQTLPADLGLKPPEVKGGSLHDDLHAIDPFHLAVAAVPTVTSHSRRALFAGEIPGNIALDDTEKPSANATADKAAFNRNPALGDLKRVLFLKGDLQKGPKAITDALTGEAHRVVAAVFNDIDDALGSQETTAMGPWDAKRLGLGFLDAIKLAIERGWIVLITSDHGHTPFIAANGHVSNKTLGNRHNDAPTEQSTLFERGPLPGKSLHLLTAVGAWHGRQRRGFHGGASLEEVVIPLAFLGSVPEGEGRPLQPTWWWNRAEQAAVEAPFLHHPPTAEPRLPGATSVPPQTASPPTAAPPISSPRVTPQPPASPPVTPQPPASPPPSSAPPPAVASPVSAPQAVAAPMPAPEVTPPPASGATSPLFVPAATQVPLVSVQAASQAPQVPVQASAAPMVSPQSPVFPASQVQTVAAPSSAAELAQPVPSGREWLTAFADAGVREVFEHLAVHSIVTEDEATRMLGSPRALRSFSKAFETLVEKAPFAARIETVGGIKRYVREGHK
jgi:hypothetical protein